MFPREHRLRHNKDIKALFANGKSVFGSLVGLRFVKNKFELSRFTVVAGLKVSKKAVVRNRLKRQVRAIVEQRLDQIKPGYDVTLLIRSKAVGKDYNELEEQIVKSLTKAKLL